MVQVIWVWVSLPVSFFFFYFPICSSYPMNIQLLALEQEILPLWLYPFIFFFSHVFPGNSSLFPFMFISPFSFFHFYYFYIIFCEFLSNIFSVSKSLQNILVNYFFYVLLEVFLHSQFLFASTVSVPFGSLSLGILFYTLCVLHFTYYQIHISRRMLSLFSFLQHFISCSPIRASQH